MEVEEGFTQVPQKYSSELRTRQAAAMAARFIAALHAHSLFCHHFAFATLVATAVLKTAVTTVTLSLRNASLSEDARFSELQCSFTGNRVDTEDGEGAKQTQNWLSFRSRGFRSQGFSWSLGSHRVSPESRIGKSDPGPV